MGWWLSIGCGISTYLHRTIWMNCGIFKSLLHFLFSTYLSMSLYCLDSYFFDTAIESLEKKSYIFVFVAVFFLTHKIKLFHDNLFGTSAVSNYLWTFGKKYFTIMSLRYSNFSSHFTSNTFRFLLIKVRPSCIYVIWWDCALNI